MQLNYKKACIVQSQSTLYMTSVSFQTAIQKNEQKEAKGHFSMFGEKSFTELTYLAYKISASDPHTAS